MGDVNLGIIFMLISGICYSFSAVWTVFVADYGVDDMMLTFIRLLSASIAMAIILIVTKKGFKISKKELKVTAIFGISGTALTIYFMSKAAGQMSAGSVSLCHYSYPIIVSLASAILYKEKFGLNKIVATILMFAGMLAANNGGSMTFLGIVFALMSAFTFAFYVFGQEHSIMVDIDPFKLFFWGTFSGAIFILLILLLSGKFILPSYGKVYGLMACGGIFTELCGTVSLFYGVRKLGASKAAYLEVLEPGLAFVWDFVIFGKRISTMGIIGVALIFSSFIAILLPIDHIAMKLKGGANNS